MYFIIQVKIGSNNSRVIGLDGDMKNSTFSEKLRNLKPEQHIECFICEQNMAGVSCVALSIFIVSLKLVDLDLEQLFKWSRPL